jgi:hypothetical protein
MGKSAKRKAKRRAKEMALAVAKAGGLGYCFPCEKLLWPTWELAKEKVAELKSQSSAKKPYLLDAYHCQQGSDGFHVGHNYKLALPVMSLCIGEHK